MAHNAYEAPRILDLGDARILTKGSYPNNPETYGNTDQSIDLADDMKRLNEDFEAR